ncbi:hypothetical protein HYPSUDRAFT_56606 [Hypholoma sublateritium FD-334 SS-4]|uniref:Uncharacterized protein n=1 Tax=Hypholoma sublateritium (strain FD-334 SS-4) TaxID=945553 RepID=A0A0D2KY71_HYPSF|nr:hypothetical protein HYPSUDRAFT_56606 [Hypholoma sublateritium FD-334 SS-4]
MFMKSNFVLLALSMLLITSEQVLGREQWLERGGRAVSLYPRRFGQEHPAVIDKLSSACPGQICGVLAGKAITPLLAAQPECSQQDMADAIIDASKQFDAATAAVMVAAAIEYRQAEKNTPPDFTTNPPKNRNSVFCQTAPKNPELNGLVQAQDPANDPTLFFDPATKATVIKGSQANTSPFAGAAAAEPAASSTSVTATATATDAGAVLIATSTDAAETECPTAVTVTVTGTVTATPTDAVTVSVGDATTTAAATTSAAAAPATTDTTVGSADFGSCTVPEIEFGVGFDNRKETSFQPTDKTSYNHGSAQNIAIITQFICDTLTNSCKANQDAKTLCASAAAAAVAAPAKTGAQADAFNNAFGIVTDFTAVAAIDDQGRPVVSSAAASATPAVTSAATIVATQASTSTAAAATTAAASTSTSSSSSSIGNFGKCTVPQIKFGVGFDNRKETSFEPVDQVSYNHGSAQNIGIITQFICDTLTNTCGADQTAKTTCATATAAAAAQASGTGAQADAFNKAFGIITQFSSVAQVDNQGNIVAGSTSTAASTSASSASTNSNTAVTVPASTTATATAGNLQTFTGALGNVAAPAVTALGNGQFQVAGNSAFNSQQSAITRSCDVQNNQCANAANASGNKNGLTVSACNAQQATCLAAAN